MNTDRTGKKQKELFKIRVEVLRETTERRFLLIERESGKGVLMTPPVRCSGHARTAIAAGLPLFIEEPGYRLAVEHPDGEIQGLWKSGELAQMIAVKLELEWMRHSPKKIAKLLIRVQHGHDEYLEAKKARLKDMGLPEQSFEKGISEPTEAKPAPEVVTLPEPVSPPPPAKRFVCQGFLQRSECVALAKAVNPQWREGDNMFPDRLSEMFKEAMQAHGLIGDACVYAFSQMVIAGVEDVERTHTARWERWRMLSEAEKERTPTPRRKHRLRTIVNSAAIGAKRVLKTACSEWSPYSTFPATHLPVLFNLLEKEGAVHKTGFEWV